MTAGQIAADQRREPRDREHHPLPTGQKRGEITKSGSWLPARLATTNVSRQRQPHPSRRPTNNRATGALVIGESGAGDLGRQSGTLRM